MANKDFIYNL